MIHTSIALIIAKEIYGESKELDRLQRVALLLDHKDFMGKCVAYLSSGLSESKVSIPKLKNAAFSQELIDALIAITPKVCETKEEWILRLKSNNIAVRVMSAILKERMDIRKEEHISEFDLEKLMIKGKELKLVKNLN